MAVGATIPAGLVDTYGTLVLLSPTSGFAPPLTTAGESLLARGGRVVVVTEHSGYADHDGAAAYLAGLGSTLVPYEEKHGGTVPVTLTPVAPLTDGVSALELYYTAAVDPGAGQTVATHEGAIGLVMDLVSGPTLRTWLETGPRELAVKDRVVQQLLGFGIAKLLRAASRGQSRMTMTTHRSGS